MDDNTPYAPVWQSRELNEAVIVYDQLPLGPQLEIPLNPQLTHHRFWFVALPVETSNYNVRYGVKYRVVFSRGSRVLETFPIWAGNSAGLTSSIVSAGTAGASPKGNSAVFNLAYPWLGFHPQLPGVGFFTTLPDGTPAPSSITIKPHEFIGSADRVVVTRDFCDKIIVLTTSIGVLSQK